MEETIIARAAPAPRREPAPGNLAEAFTHLPPPPAPRLWLDRHMHLVFALAIFAGALLAVVLR